MKYPRRRAVLAVCAALLLVTAGCSGGTGPTTTTPTDDLTTLAATTDDSTTVEDATTSSETTTETDNATAPNPEVPASTTGGESGTGTWSPNASVDQYPPGVADNGSLVNVSRLLDAHFAATANASVVFTVETSGPNQTATRTYGHGADGTPYYSSRDTTDEGVRVVEESYWTGSRGYTRTYASTRPEIGTVYRALQNVTFIATSTWEPGRTFGPRNNLGISLQQGNYTVNGTVERDGRTLVELTADDGSLLGPGEMMDYDGRVLVAPNGVVYDLGSSATWTGDDGGEEHWETNITVATGVEWTGAPSWMDGIPQLSLSIVEDGHAVEVRNTGGAALPANTSLDIYARNEPLRGEVESGEPSDWRGRSPSRNESAVTVTTAERLEPGGAVYVTADADGSASSFALHDEPTRAEYEFGFAGLRSTRDDTAYWLATGFVPWDAD